MSWDGKIFEKYKIAHADGTPLKGKKYFVLRLDSDNPEEAARVNAAMAAYRGENVLNASVREMIGRIYTHLSHYVAHQITDTSLCLRVKNEINSYLANAKREDIGDNAAVREALGKMCRAAFNVILRYGNAVEVMHDLAVASDEAREALKEPARNCDVYRTKEDAEKAFLNEPCDDPCGNCTIKDINNECGVKWLFAKHNRRTNDAGGSEG